MEKSNKYKYYIWFQKHHLKHICKNCGKKISLLNISIRSLQTKASRNHIPKFCSLKCRVIYTFPKGRNHVAYKTGKGKGHIQKFSHQAIIILGGKCEVCKRTKNIEAHHIDENPRNNILSNIKILCRRCHRKLHWTKRRKWKSYKEAHQFYNEQKRKKKQQRFENAFYKKFKTKKYFRIKDLCKKYHLTRERIRQLRMAKRIEFIKIGGSYLCLGNIKNQK